MKIVQTKNGTRCWGPFNEKKPHTDEQAEALCETLNGKAEELGIKTRYEVVEKQ